MPTTASTTGSAPSARKLAVAEARRGSRPPSPLSVVWEGPQRAHTGLAVVNRELCAALAGRNGLRVTVRAAESANASPPPGGPFDVTVRYEWPPNWAAPTDGHLVMLLSWDYSRLPRVWLEPIDELVDEIWAPTRYVRDCIIRSGVRPAQVAVVPHGVDPRRFHPSARPLWLPTRKRFKLLFVGGTLERKGVDTLLEVYTGTFRPDDDVCLVIKDFGTGTIYRGQGMGETIRALRADPRNPEILYVDATFPDAMMPSLYRAADCLVHPFRGEGFGLPIAEAMACGLPVVVPDFGPTRDFCDPSVAYLVPAEEVLVPSWRVGDLELVDQIRWARVDRDALAQTMRAVVGNPDEARAVGRRASDWAHKNLSWDRAADAALRRLKALRARPVRRFGHGGEE